MEINLWHRCKQKIYPIIDEWFCLSLKMKSKWVCIDASIKKEEVTTQNTATEEFHREIFLLQNPRHTWGLAWLDMKIGVMCSVD